MSVGFIASSLVSGLDSTSNNSFSKMQQAWKDFEKSLESGDLDGAKKAYATITQLQQQITSKFGNAPGNSRLSSDMDALGKALDSGNLSDAQRERLLAVAKRCPVAKTLTSEIRIEESLV